MAPRRPAAILLALPALTASAVLAQAPAQPAAPATPPAAKPAETRPAETKPAATKPADAKPDPKDVPALAPGVPAPQPGQTVTVTTVAIPKAPAAPANPADIKTADELLVSLEGADAKFRSLQARLVKTDIAPDLEGGGVELSDGQVMFVADPAPAGAAPGAKGRRKFQVDFTSSTVDGVRHPEARTFIFDGEWFVEIKPAVKQIHRRQIVPKGQTVDPLAIGEGPFPIPIGQKRDRILSRFKAELLKGDDLPPLPGQQGKPNLPSDFADGFQLRLVPLPGTTEAKQFTDVRVWYRKADLLPVGARTETPAEKVTVFNLQNVKLNAPLPPGAFNTDKPAPDWDEQTDVIPDDAGATAPATPTPAPATPSGASAAPAPATPATKPAPGR